MEPTVLRVVRFGTIELPEWQITSDFLFPYGNGVFGGTGSGKTTFANSLIQTINDSGKAPRALLFNPTGNADYKSLFPQAFIHSQIDKTILDSISASQKDIATVCRACNERKRLDGLYQKYCRSPQVETSLSQLKLAEATTLRQLANIEPDPGKLASARAKVTKVALEKHHLLLRRAISEWYQSHHQRINTLVRDEFEARLMRYMWLDPGLLVLFDDCGATLDEIKNSKFLKELYFQARHDFVASVMILQDATSIKKGFRENMHRVFFTSPDTLINYFALMKNKRDLDIAQAIASSNFFDRTNEWRVVIYDRLAGGKFGFTISRGMQLRPYGSDIFREYAQRLGVSDDTKLHRILG